MAYPDDIRCLFSTELRHVGDGSYVIDIPERELSLGSLSPHETYRVTIERLETETDLPAAPVEIGDERTVEIETIGEQGDGIARVERGFVIIVPDTDVGERVRVEVTDVKQSVAFASVLERISYYE
jgi:Predicted RNA-binding protein, contains TRAM domain